MRFQERVTLKVYLEGADEKKLAEKAKASGKLVAEYVRDLILDDLSGVMIEMRLDAPVIVEKPRAFCRVEGLEVPNAESHLRPRRRDQAADPPSPEVAPAVAQAEGPVRHTASSNWLTCLCPTCIDKRKKNDIPLGGMPPKKKGWKR
jgi:hypothetical protein